MRFRTVQGIGNKLVDQFYSSYLHNGPNLNFRRRLTSQANFREEDILLFFNKEVHGLLRKLTGFDLEIIFRPRKLGEKLHPPEYKFMTSEEVQKAFEEANKKAEKFLQMPPIVPIRKEVDVVLSRDPELIGYDESKYLITDISFGKTDRTRTIVARDPDGTLRKAYWSERRYANQAYFPCPGREFRIPKMFRPELLKPILERGDYIFILDRACIEFDADDPEYHRVTHTTFDHVDEKRAYGSLRFSRYFGPMVFYLVLKNNIDNLLLENLQTDRLEDAASLIRIYHIVHPSAKSAGTKLEPGQEVTFIKEYIDKDSKLKVALDLALMNQNKSQKTSQAQAS